MPRVPFSLVQGLGTVAKGFLWELSFPRLPSAIAGIVPNAPDVLRLRVRSLTIPKRSMEPIIDNYMGIEITDTGAPSYEHNWTCNFTETIDGSVLKIIESWLDLSFDPETGEAVRKEDRVVDIQLRLLQALSDADEAYMTYTLKNAQPSSNPDTNLDYADKTAKVDLSITWLYDIYLHS